MSRGKPAKAQLDISNGMMDVLTSDSDMVCEAGVDCRNYGVLEGFRRQGNCWRICLKCRKKHSDLR